jgi:excisionase family DNA binding protein
MVETMSQQEMQKVMEGLRVLVEWLQRGKEIKPPQKVEGTWSNVPEVLQVNELAEILNVSRWTAYELCRRPDFPAVRIGRRILVRKDQLQAWLDLQVEYSKKKMIL